jgi:hypothetical protein
MEDRERGVAWSVCWSGLVLAAGLASPAAAQDTVDKTVYLQGPARQALLERLEARTRHYDPEAKLVVIEQVHVEDNTRMGGQRAHPTRESIDFAAELLEANEPRYREMACQIIRKVLSLQDTNRWHLTFGLWPWYAEEPLSKMFMPDFNWAAFIGKTLLYIMIHHADQLPTDLRADVREAILRACTCIRRRPLHVSYTNIASMCSYVTLVAGERLGDPKSLVHGRWLFDKWYDYTMYHGSFTEFNSPTYTRVALEVVSRMLADFLDPVRRAKAERINRMLWTHVARRFHAPTWQWAGPYSRAYGELPGSGFDGLIRPTPDGGAEFVPPAELGLDVTDWCAPYRPPRDELAHYLKPLTKPREEVEVFFKGGQRLLNGLGNVGGRFKRDPIVGTTCLHPRFALGTVNLMDFWEQHRNLIAYWGTREKPAYMTMRCMNGEHGFCSAFFACAQRMGDVLAGVTFATDFGNRFIDLDVLPNHTLICESLRIEFGGHLADAVVPDHFDLAQQFVVTDRGMRMWLRYVGGSFAGQEPSAEVIRARHHVTLVLNLYKGPTRSFCLPSLKEAVSLFALSLGDDAAGEANAVDPQLSRQDGAYCIRWKPRQDELTLKVPIAPLAFDDLQKHIESSVNGDPPWKRATPLLSEAEQ